MNAVLTTVRFTVPNFGSTSKKRHILDMESISFYEKHVRQDMTHFIETCMASSYKFQGYKKTTQFS